MPASWPWAWVPWVGPAEGSWGLLLHSRKEGWREGLLVWGVPAASRTGPPSPALREPSHGH